MNQALENLVPFREIKQEIRVLGIDDCPFKPHQQKTVMLLGVVFRGGLWFDGAMRTEVKVDGRDSTDKIVEMVLASRHYKQLRVIMLDSLTVAGFNIIDLEKLNKKTKLPILAITKDQPDNEKVKNALKNLRDWEERWKTIEKAGSLNQILIGKTNLFVHIKGAAPEDARKIIRITSTRANYPEPLRVAHLLAQALYGKSTNKNKSNKCFFCLRNLSALNL